MPMTMIMSTTTTKGMATTTATTTGMATAMITGTSTIITSTTIRHSPPGKC